MPRKAAALIEHSSAGDKGNTATELFKDIRPLSNSCRTKVREVSLVAGAGCGCFCM
ncbi:hypothetical protein [Radiobacillus deserti]|uniref:hypothetical protein n=1 Tax=Radiobacillus deserti TaxID=2594883 RepID=UPI0013151EA5|nr:hypothetical protein [Radiobacillus deserti]